MRRRSFFASLLVLAAIALLGVTPAGAAVYWGGESGVGVANLDGSQAIQSLPASPPPPAPPQARLDPWELCGMAVDADHIYWANRWAGTIGRANLDGTGGNEIFIAGLGDPCGVAVDGTHIYWTDTGTNMIGRARLDGSGVQPAFIAAGSAPCGVALAGGYLYWAIRGDNAIARAGLDGSGVDREFIVGTETPCGVAVGGGFIFWASEHDFSSDAGTISRAALGGGSVVDPLITGTGETRAIAVSSTHVFWADQGRRNFTSGDPTQVLPGSVGSARLDGTEVNRRLIRTPPIAGVAVDSRLLPTPTPVTRPSDYLRFGKVRHAPDGSLRLDVFVPARGLFKVLSPRIGWSIEKGNPPPWFAGSFRWSLRLWPGKPKSAVARRIQRQLHEKGRAPVTVRMLYRQEGRTAIQASKRLAFER
ncbi:MAG: hypothetical protein QOE75_625 [Solirubrobacterales bacterium]|jgi:hypothetical protein|nr:hypothetical protein [Solirubrobacterales bacterium]